ncbi:MAG: hypothetical protein ABUT20_40310 [Bacteroidota bacterium]
MNKFNRLILPVFLLSITHLVQAQNVPDSTGLPGDNFSLEGALDMFKKASSPEEFEKLINTEDNGVNNLDLDNDGNIDYVKVIDKKDGDVHAFVLQVAVSEKENQDIAVIELEKTGSDNAVLQIVGDEDIYGEQTIVEPSDDAVSFANAPAEVIHGPYAASYDNNLPDGLIVNVWMWPAVRFVYAPAYTVWVSPWSWRLHPVWWRPRRPLYWHAFYPRRVVYTRHYTVVTTHRVVRAHRIYRPVRVTSVAVRTRYQPRVSQYRVTRRTTVVEGPRGNRVKVHRTKAVKRRRF